MGLDAYVACNCYREGKASRPSFADRLMIDEFGEVALAATANIDRIDRQQLDAWKENACPHSYMWCVNERIGSWGGVGVFLDMLDLLDPADFKALKQAVANGNYSPAADEVAGAVFSQLIVEQAA